MTGTRTRAFSHFGVRFYHLPGARRVNVRVRSTDAPAMVIIFSMAFRRRDMRCLRAAFRYARKRAISKLGRVDA
jgi:hypothetical protein